MKKVKIAASSSETGKEKKKVETAGKVSTGRLCEGWIREFTTQNDARRRQTREIVCWKR
jgi:hypothetical protein